MSGDKTEDISDSLILRITVYTLFYILSKVMTYAAFKVLYQFDHL